MGSSHQRVRRLRRLVQKRSLRWSEGTCVLEGPDLVLAALDASVAFEAIYVDPSRTSGVGLAELEGLAAARGVRVFALAPGVLERVADAATPQPVLGAVRLPLVDVASIPCRGLLMVLHGVRDPGNAGTLIRSADAAGASGVIFTGHSVDPFNPKTLRASAGSIFHVPVALNTLSVTLDSFRSRGAASYATVVRGGVSHRLVDFTKPTVVVIGNEADGLDEESIARCDDALTIEMVGSSESLNAGVAGSLVAFEALWQREDTSSTPPTPSL
ncbi:MAG: TrmH family RNA methyltransferase [Acidimicrobiales bacterium]